jgi:hypothetical protein
LFVLWPARTRIRTWCSNVTLASFLRLPVELIMPDDAQQEPRRILRCPECGRVASVPDYCARPICVHADEPYAPEVWDGDDENGRPIEQSPNEEWRTPGPSTWAEMVPVTVADEQATRQSARAEALRDAAGKLRAFDFTPDMPNASPLRVLDMNAASNRLADFLESLASDNEGKADGNGG